MVTHLEFLEVESAEVDFIEAPAVIIESSPEIPPETIEACRRLGIEQDRVKIMEQTHSGFDIFERFFELHYGAKWRERRRGRRGDCEYCKMGVAEMEEWRKRNK